MSDFKVKMITCSCHICRQCVSAPKTTVIIFRINLKLKSKLGCVKTCLLGLDAATAVWKNYDSTIALP